MVDKDQKNRIIEECKELMSKAGYSESDTEQFCDIVSGILYEFVYDHRDEQREFRYKLVKHLDRVEFRLDISGNKIDPMADGYGAGGRRFRNAVNCVLFNPDSTVSVVYTSGWNHIFIKSPSKIANSKLLSNSMVRAMLLGLVAGIFAKFMPDGIKSVFIDGGAWISSLAAQTVQALMLWRYTKKLDAFRL